MNLSGDCWWGKVKGMKGWFEGGSNHNQLFRRQMVGQGEWYERVVRWWQKPWQGNEETV